MAMRKSLQTLQAEEAQGRAALAKKRQALSQAQAALRTAETKALNRRRFIVGKLVLDTALGSLPIADLESWIDDAAQRYQASLNEGPDNSLSSLPCISSEIHPNAETGSTE
jgi:hypothetical protein